MTDITASEDQLFDAWGPGAETIGADPDYKTSERSADSARDGCVCPEEWLAVPLRLVFILKEINHAGSPGLFDLRSALHEGPNSRQVGRVGAETTGGRSPLAHSWDNVLRWLHAIHSDEIPPWATLRRICVNTRPEALHGVCAVNLNKRGRGTAKALATRIGRAARYDEASLRRQLRLYREAGRPVIYVCCGTAEWVHQHGLLEDSCRPRKQRFVWQYTSRGVPFHRLGPDAWVVDYCHPNARVDDPLIVYPLVEAVRGLMSSNEGTTDA